MTAVIRRNRVELGIIAGSGIYAMQGFHIKEEREIVTPFGEPSDRYRIVEIEGIVTAFLNRHGPSHIIPPHMINYRANIWGFKELGVERIISISAVGGIADNMNPGDIVLPDQIIDITSGRSSTFYDGPEVVHIDFTEPYCLEMRDAIIKAGLKAGVLLIDKGTYICTNGPRLESRAEIKAYRALGAHVVGMTGMPEACLSRELGLCFAGLSVITNYAAGIGKARLTTTEVLETMRGSTSRLKSLLKEACLLIPQKRSCACKDVLKEAKMSD